MVTNDEKQYLRELAYQLKEASETEKNDKKRQEWYDLNDLKEGVKPLYISHYWPTAQAELFPADTFRCTTEHGKELEQYFKTRMFYHNDLEDDNVMEPLVYVKLPYELENYTGMPRQTKRSAYDDGTGAFEIVPTLVNEEDIDKITPPTLTYEKEVARAKFQETKDVFDGILTTIKLPFTWPTKISDEYSWYRGMEETYMDMYDNPEWMHKVLGRIAKNFDQRFDLLEESGIWTCLDLSEPLGSAGLRYISGMKDFRDYQGQDLFELKCKTGDNWGFSCSEVFHCVSNDMHDEFSYQYDIKAMERVKFCNIGCCEVLDKKIDLIRQFKNARKISVSEWCDYERAAASIKRDYVYSYRAAGVHFMGAQWDKAGAEKEIRGVLEATKRHNCNTEIALNIGGTFNGNPREKAIEWSKQTRALIEEMY